MLAEGGELDDPATFVKRLNKLMLALAGGPASRIWTPGGSCQLVSCQLSAGPVQGCDARSVSGFGLS